MSDMLQTATIEERKEVLRTVSGRWIKVLCRLTVLLVSLAGAANVAARDLSGHSVARLWNEELLSAIRRDYATPTIHARNLYHTSVAMFDAWAAFDSVAQGVITPNLRIRAEKPREAQEIAISYAAYRLIQARFQSSPGAAKTLLSIRSLMAKLGYDPDFSGLIGNDPAAVGNRCAMNVILFGLHDGSNQTKQYAPPNYVPLNAPLVVKAPGAGPVADPNSWQPLSLDSFVDQFGNALPWSQQLFLTPHWGGVTPFGLRPKDMHPEKPGVYFDPGPPPKLGGDRHEIFRDAMTEVLLRSSLLDPNIEDQIDISPASLGNNSVGTNDGHGYALNPRSGHAYEPHLVRVGDFARALSEFWADGPSTEAPPGHWNVIANDISDHPLNSRRIGGQGPTIDRLEWDVKLYLVLNGAVHDAGVACWGTKGYYNSVRPITAIRYMANLGQSSDPLARSYHPLGLPLIPDKIELITDETAAPGGRHSELAEQMLDEFGHAVRDSDGNPVMVRFVGEIAVKTWRGPRSNPKEGCSGVGWIRAKRWMPYQLPTFVTPPFSGYTSGHSTFSRAAAEVLAHFTGDKFFPGGLGTYRIEPGHLRNEFGPSKPVVLQWATYYDAADQSGQSRIYGGIHPWIDDLPARIMGSQIGIRAWEQAQKYFDPK